MPTSMTDLIPLDPLDFIDMATTSPWIKTTVLYAQPQHPHNPFGQLYKPDAKLYLHKSLASLVVYAAEMLHSRYDWTLVLFDGLRPVEAQEKLWQHNPDPEFYAKPGEGGHPRGMAVDLYALDSGGRLVNFGSPIESCTAESSRSCRKFSDDRRLNETINLNRVRLEWALREAGSEAGNPIWPLPHEWWDFRFMPDYYNRFAPIYDRDLPNYMKLLS